MPSIELNKLQGVSGVRALAQGDRSQFEKSPASRVGTAQSADAKPGVEIEVAAGLDAAEPPVDSDRVSQIRDALRDGTYPLVPTKIADAMIAARVGFGLEK